MHRLLFSFLLMLTITARAEVREEAQAVDALLRQDWAAHELQPNAPASDETSVRRVYLDVAGRIPTFPESQAFLASADKNKRAKLIDTLLAGEGYVSHFYNFWSDILRNHTRSMGSLLATAYGEYLKTSLRTNKPYDQFVRELLIAQGKAWENGAVGYYLRDRGMPLDNMANTVRIFLGTRIECAQCHDHPFDKWTQRQFYQMAAFTHGVDVADYSKGPMTLTMKHVQEHRSQIKLEARNANGTPDAAMRQRHARIEAQDRFTHSAVVTTWGPLYYTWSTFINNPLRLPHDYKYADGKPHDLVTPAAMMGKADALSPSSSSLETFALWMTAPENPRFTRVIANRLWKKVFGIGLIDPADEIMDSTTPAIPALMQHLEQLMIRQRYDMRAFLRVLLNTQAYQSEVTREEILPGIVYHFTGPVLRRMTAEQIWDSLVTLIHPSPDLINMEARDNNTRRLLAARKLCDALESLTPEQLEQRLTTAGTRSGEASTRLAEINQQLVAARAAKNKPLVDELMQASMPYRQIGRQAVDEDVLLPALAELNAKTHGTDALQKIAKPTGDVTNDHLIPGYDLDRNNAARKASDTAEYARLGQLADFYGLTAKEKIYFPGECFSASRRWPRAADMVSPSIPGHYLRDFGQSDRETIENASTDASIPQALILMNSELIPEILGAKSQLMRSLATARTPTEKLDHASLTLLSRHPTDSERQRWNAAQSNGSLEIEDWVFALLNTQQFVFVR